MPPSERVLAAFRAMKVMGIPESKTKPVLKKLLRVYEKNWELIEEENYRALADAIFDDEDTAAASSAQKKTPECMNHGNALAEEEEDNSERPLKRLRKGPGQVAASAGPSSTSLDGYVMEKPWPEQTDDPEEDLDQGSGILHRRNRGKRPMPSQGVEMSESLIKSHNDLLNDGIPVSEMPLDVIYPEPSPEAWATSKSSSSHGFPQNVAQSKQNGVKPMEMASPAGVQVSNNIQDTNGQSSTAVLKAQCSANDVRCTYDARDLSRGEEKVQVSLVGQFKTDLPAFCYISRSIVYSSARVKFSLARIGDKICCPTCYGDCSLSSTPCACVSRNGGGFAYTPEGNLTERFLEKYISELCNDRKKHLFHCKSCPLEKCKKEAILEPCKGHLERKFIKECWARCGCSKICVNRVVQRGITHKLQVFWTPEGKGWGLRSLEGLPKGAFVCEYAGEILTVTELHQRSLEKVGSATLSYAVALDAGWDSGCLKDDQTLCLDATVYGNVARFINHRCLDANLIEIPVQVETPDRHYYHVALFTKRKIDALEELTWDYGVDFDYRNSLFKPFSCLCGSNFCRNLKHPSSRAP